MSGGVRKLGREEGQAAWERGAPTEAELESSEYMGHLSSGTPVIQDWLTVLPIQQQSVLILACRGPDGIPKWHPAKVLIRNYRACVLNAATTGRPLEPGRGDSFMENHLLYAERADADLEHGRMGWNDAVMHYMDHVDEIPHHYHLHLLHGAQILGYRHPEKRLVRPRWLNFYRQGVDDMHLTAETREQMDRRLNDFGSTEGGRNREARRVDY